MLEVYRHRMNDPGERQSVLIVDDNRLSVQLLAATARREGFTVVEATDGHQALERLEDHAIDIVITDWEMPGCTGLELVETIRAREADPYRYLIMVTQHGDSGHRHRGLAAGADDFLGKPVADAEVSSRLRVARRIVAMSRSLAHQRDALAESQARFEAELAQAARVQAALLPDAKPDLDGWAVDWRCVPCDRLAGDSLGLVQFGSRRLGAYVFDVSGHGVTAALLATQVSRALSADRGVGSVVFAPGGAEPADPAAVLDALNRRFPMRTDMPQLVAMTYALIDLDQGAVRWSSAAIPPPYLVTTRGCRPRDLEVDPFLGARPDTTYRERSGLIGRGERLVLTTDGLDEARNARRSEFGQERVAVELQNAADQPLDAAVDALLAAVDEWSDPATGQTDDRTLLAIERH